MISQATALLTKGILGAGVTAASCGYIISIKEYTPPVVVPPTRRKHGSVGQPNNKKLVTISCWAYGEVYTETLIVDRRTRITTKDVKIVEGDDGSITIQVKDIKTY